MKNFVCAETRARARPGEMPSSAGEVACACTYAAAWLYAFMKTFNFVVYGTVVTIIPPHHTQSFY